MNAPLFNPIWFYFIELFDRFSIVFIVIGLFAVISGGATIFFYKLEDEYIPKCTKKIIITGAIVALIGGIMPSEETCYKMIVASYVTPANIESVRGEAIDLVDYIIEKVDELTDNEESD